MKVIYIAGKYRGKSEWEVTQNIRKAEELAIFVWKNGGAAICPHKNTAYFGGICPDETWLKGDLEIIKRCDAVYALPYWIDSEGAKSEIEFSLKNGIVVFDDEEDLLEYLRQ